MTNLRIIILVIGLAVALTVTIVAIVAWYADLLRIVRRCATDTGRKKGEEWKDAIRDWEKTDRDLKDLKATRKENARTKGEAFTKAVSEQVTDLWDDRNKELVVDATAILKFSGKLLGTTYDTTNNRYVVGSAGGLLVVVLMLIHYLYYRHFGFNVIGYLPDYSVSGVVLSLLQVSFLLVLWLSISVVTFLLAIPLATLHGTKIVNGMRWLVRERSLGFFFAVCKRWMMCSSYLVLPLLDNARTGSDSEADRARKRTSSRFFGSDSFIMKYGSDESRDRDRNLDRLTLVLFAILFSVGSTIAICVVPERRAHAACEGSIITRVVLDPPLGGVASFTRIGSIGGHVFIVSESSCGHGTENRDVGEVEDGQSEGGDNESRKNSGVTVVPLNRVLCMHEVRDDSSSESANCTAVVPSVVRMRMDGEWRLRDEIEQEVCPGGVAEISAPILFAREEETPVDEPAAKELIKAFLNRPELQGVKLHVLGFASGDGISRYNEDLAWRRAKAVAEDIRELDGSRTLETDSWGETHMTNGVANSRSVRIVGCLRKTSEPADSAAQGAHEAPTGAAERGTEEEAT